MNLSQLKFRSFLNFTVTSLLSLVFHSQRLKHKDHTKIVSFSKIKIVKADMDQQERELTAQPFQTSIKTFGMVLIRFSRFRSRTMTSFLLTLEAS